MGNEIHLCLLTICSRNPSSCVTGSNACSSSEQQPFYLQQFRKHDKPQTAKRYNSKNNNIDYDINFLSVAAFYYPSFSRIIQNDVFFSPKFSATANIVIQQQKVLAPRPRSEPRYIIWPKVADKSLNNVDNLLLQHSASKSPSSRRFPSRKNQRERLASDRLQQPLKVLKIRIKLPRHP